MKIDDQNDLELIRRYQKGEERAFAELFSKYYPLAYKIFIMKGIPRTEAEDLTAEIFIKLIEALKSYRLEKPFEHYLRRVVRNRLFDYYRSKKIEWLSLELHLSVRSQSEDRDFQEIVAHCLQRIKSLIRRAILLSWLEGYKRRQIAELLQLPIGTVHSNLERGKRDFRECVQRELGD